MRSLNLDQLRALLEVVEHGSFSAAARRLNLTQPAISLPHPKSSVGNAVALAFGEQLAFELRARQKVPIWVMIDHGGFEKL